MSRASRCLRSNGCEKFIVEPPKIIVTIILPKCIATLLILLGVLAQMTGEAVSSAAASAATGGHHYQIQRVMSMHNNSSSTLPFIPSSTGSLLTSSSQYSNKNQHQQAILANALKASSQQIKSAQPQKVQLAAIGSAAAGQHHIPSWSPSSSVSSSQSQNPVSVQQHRKFQSGRTTSVNFNPKSASFSSSSSQFSVKSPSSISSSRNLVSVPIRHWWMAVYHHHGDQHSSSIGARASRVKRLLASAEARQNFTQCLHEDVVASSSQHADILSLQGESAWEDRVCATRTLNDRVHVLLEALPCHLHRVCQILSPTLLQRLARPDECRQVARDLWRNVFHKLHLMIRDFSDVLQQKFDIGNYSTMHENEMCKEAYAFWICSTHLPMWLLDSDSDKYVEVEACRSTCLMVEKRCPFLIKGTEDDMASGNPSFMCKDADVPPMVTEDVIPTPCCYKKSLEPLPGHGFPLKVAAGFCHEPDHVQLHLNESDTKSSGASSASDNAAGSIRKLSTSVVSTSLPATFHASTCDTILWPSTSLNVTSAKEYFNTSSNTAGRNKSSANNTNLEESSEDPNEEADNLIVALARWLGVSDTESELQEAVVGRNTAKKSKSPQGLACLVLLLIHPLILQWWLR